MDPKVRLKALVYCGIHGGKFALKTGDVYAEPMDLKYIMGLTLNSKVEAVEVFADDELQLNVPSDSGYEGELNATAPDPELDKRLGLSVEGADGLVGVNMTAYAYGALYFEHTQQRKGEAPYTVKAWLFNVEIGKGSESYATNKKSPEMGSYAYPFKTLGDPLMDADGLKEALDANGMRHKAFRVTSYPGDTGYETFGDKPPVPKVLAAEAAQMSLKTPKVQ